jgi:hypothetical protein
VKKTPPALKSKNMAERDKADKAYDKAHAIKQGSPKDIALDKARGVFQFEYGKKKGKK